MRLRICLFFSSFFVGAIAFAASASKEPPSHWKGSNARLGALINTGNTDSSDLAAALNLFYQRDRWKNTTELSTQFSRDSGETTAESYRAKDQLQYSFTKSRKNYIYTMFDYLQDKFAAYQHQGAASIGYGREIVTTDQWQVSVEAGPGMRYSKADGSTDAHKEFIFNTAANAVWQLMENLAFKQQLEYDIGSSYNYFQSLTSLTNQLIGHLATELSYRVQYYSSIPPGSSNTQKTDTTTNISLVYTF